MVRPVLLYNHIIYSEPSAIAEIGPGTNALLADMWDTLAACKLPWLCAKHIGVNVQVAVIDTSHIQKNERLVAPEDFRAVVINPKISPTSALVNGLLEWDAALPQLAISIARERKILAQWQNNEGESGAFELEGYAARAMQHCTEVFEGRLMTNNLSPNRKASLRSHLSRIKSGKVPTHYPIAPIVQSTGA